MFPADHITCHHTRHRKKCKDLCGGCWKWIQVQGHNPNTGEMENQWKCADAWLPLLLIENSQQQRQTGAAVESFRNEVSGQNKVLIQQVQREGKLLGDKNGLV